MADSGNSLENTVSIEDLNNIFDTIFSIANVWYNFGLALGVRVHTLKRIEVDYFGRCVECLRETLSEWLQNDESTTWQDVIEALCSQTVGQRKIAKKIGRLDWL